MDIPQIYAGSFLMWEEAIFASDEVGDHEVVGYKPPFVVQVQDIRDGHIMLQRVDTWGNWSATYSLGWLTGDGPADDETGGRASAAKADVIAEAVAQAEQYLAERSQKLDEQQRWLKHDVQTVARLRIHYPMEVPA